MKKNLTTHDWTAVFIFLMSVLFLMLVTGLAFLGKLVLLPVLGYFWTVTLCFVLSLALTYGFLEYIFLRY